MNALLRQQVSTWPIGALLAASTALWFAVVVSIPDGKGLAENLSDSGWAVALGCPFFNLVLAAALVWAYARQAATSRNWLCLVCALIVALLPWVWILTSVFTAF